MTIKPKTPDHAGKMDKPEIGNAFDLDKLINSKLQTLSNILDIAQEELNFWMNENLHIPKEILFLGLRVAITNQLDPTLNELTFIEIEKGKFKPFITSSGWIKAINRQATFDGMMFTYSTELMQGMPTWIECTIWRKDRHQPIQVREYMSEAKSAEPIWQKIPGRLLRNRAISECAMLTFGLIFPIRFQPKSKLNQSFCDTNKAPLKNSEVGLKINLSMESRVNLLKRQLKSSVYISNI